MSETIQIKTLTPLWTGDVEGKSTKIKETGILGSLRWWYEALVRGMGGNPCDPTDSECQFNYKAYKETGDIKDGFIWEKNPEKNICHVCKVFGCNGWEKRFSFRVPIQPSVKRINFLKKIHGVKGIDNRSTLNMEWWYKRTYKSKEAIFSSSFFPLELFSNSKNYTDENIRDIFGYLLVFISETGALGAKAQNGFGVIDVKKEGLDLEEGYDLIKKSIDEEKEISFPHYFKVEITFPLDFPQESNHCFMYKLDDCDTLETGQMMKYLTRLSLKNSVSKVKNICENYEEIKNSLINRRDSQENTVEKIVARHLLGSDLKGDEMKRASLLNFSNMWREEDVYSMRIWGFVPEEITFNNRTTKIDKKGLIKSLQEIFMDNFDIEHFSDPITCGDISEEVFK